MHLKVEQLAVALRGIPIVEGFSCSVRNGEVVAIFGASGVGKTTILRAIAGLVQFVPRESIRWYDKGGAPIPVPRPLGFVRQRDQIPEWLSVGQFMRMCSLASAGRRGDGLQGVDESLKAVGLNPAVDIGKHPHQLSGGMITRVVLAGAIATGSQVMLFDEPLTMLDEPTRYVLLPLLKGVLARTEIGVIVTHSVREAAFLADRIIAIRLASGCTEMFERPGMRHLGDAPGALKVRELREELLGFCSGGK